MYQFKIKNQEDGSYKFELGNINLIVDGYVIENNQHKLNNPGKAIAYFNIENNIYGVSNDPGSFCTAEEFYDAINQQYQIFAKNNIKRTA